MGGGFKQQAKLHIIVNPNFMTNYPNCSGRTLPINSAHGDGMMKKKIRHKVVGHDGDPCPRCKRPTEIREHIELRDRQLRAYQYYSRWFYCTNRSCLTRQIMPERYKVLRSERVEWGETEITGGDLFSQ